VAKSEKKIVPVAKDQQHLIELIEKAHGAGAVMVGRGRIVNVKSFSTGIASIDVALGCGGLPQGRIMEVYGPESGGKTTTCLQFIAACQKHRFEDKDREGVAAFIDAEHALDPVWAEKIGVDMDQVLLSQPNSGEEAFSIVEMMVKSKLVDLIIVDSVAALVPQVELVGELTDANVGAHARMMSKALRKLKGEISNSKTTVIFINQIREKVGVMFGSPETTPGGRALKFYASIRGEVRRGSTLKEGDDVVGFRTSMKMVKNKVAAPFMKAEFDICVGRAQRPIYGIDGHASLIDVAEGVKVVTRKGSHFRFGDIILGNGLAKASTFLRDNPEISKEIRDKTYGKAFEFLDKCPVVGDTDDADSDPILDGDDLLDDDD
jgi:recombination protein RecA